MVEAVAGLDTRVRALERQARWWRAAAVIAAAAVAASRLLTGNVAAGETPEELQARRFVLVARDGRPLAALEASPEGAARLTLQREGVARIALALAGDGSPSLSLNDASAAPRILLSANGPDSQVSVAGPARTRVLLAND